MRGHFRAEVHRYASRPQFAAAGSADITIASNEARIAEGKARIAAAELAVRTHPRA
jgi:hypothetical protein